MGENGDFISSYLSYTDATEVPTFFSRWSAIAGIGALLGRNYFFQHGHFTVQPNLYCMFIGEPGTKKSTAIKTIKQLLKASGYLTFAPNKTSKEKFLAKLSAMASDEPTTEADILEQNLFNGHDSLKGPIECFICADEFNNFLGNGNIEFISILGELWDYSGLYENELKNSKSDFIPDPTISILSGNTQTNFKLAFPPESLGQGFFSRLLLIYCDTARDKITFPPEPDPLHTAELHKFAQRIRSSVVGRATMAPSSKALLDKIYKTWRDIDDVRFSHYSNRRLSHLIKLCLSISAARLSNVVSESDIIYANTVLTHTENLMPKALGEFGKARNSDINHKIMQIIDTAVAPITIREIWMQVMNDLDSIRQLSEIISSLLSADKIQSIPERGILPKKKVRKFDEKDDTLDWSLLTNEEKRNGL